jgi:hypothetical protein
VQHGPFRHLRTLDGVLHADDYSLNVRMPGRDHGDSPRCHEIAFVG